MTAAPVVLYDTTLRDGTQGENITLSLADKLRVVAKALARLVRPVASDWLSPGPPRTPFSWANRLAMVSYCEAAAPADSCSWAKNWLVMRWMLATSTPMS